jgi:hypothetical protein
MKRNLLILFAFVAATEALAQITIKGTDLPNTNDLYVRDNAGNTSIIDLNVTGPNTTWDYSALTSNGLDTIDYMTVGSTNFAYQFYFNNPFSPDYDSDLGIDGIDFPAIPAVPITITDVINYFKVANDGYYQTGFGASISGIPASVKYDPRDKVLPLPCNFGATTSNQFAWNFEVPSVGSYGQRKTRTVEVDGWGTLKLPNGGNYDVLRVKSTIEGIDTIYVNQFNFGFAIPSTQLEYKWYANGQGEPLMTVTASDLFGTQTITGVNHKHHEPSGLQSKNMLQTNLDLFPNPTSDIAQIKYNSITSGNITIAIIDIAGNMVFNQQEYCAAYVKNDYQINLKELPAGYYTIQLSQNGTVAAAKLLKK